ncbi:hypothetical protein JCM11491_003880 [Sporobolomyces phaffii]
MSDHARFDVNDDLLSNSLGTADEVAAITPQRNQSSPDLSEFSRTSYCPPSSFPGNPLPSSHPSLPQDSTPPISSNRACPVEPASTALPPVLPFQSTAIPSTSSSRAPLTPDPSYKASPVPNLLEGGGDEGDAFGREGADPDSRMHFASLLRRADLLDHLRKKKKKLKKTEAGLAKGFANALAKGRKMQPKRLKRSQDGIANLQATLSSARSGGHDKFEDELDPVLFFGPGGLEEYIRSIAIRGGTTNKIVEIREVGSRDDVLPLDLRFLDCRERTALRIYAEDLREKHESIGKRREDYQTAENNARDGALSPKAVVVGPDENVFLSLTEFVKPHFLHLIERHYASPREDTEVAESRRGAEGDDDAGLSEKHVPEPGLAQTGTSVQMDSPAGRVRQLSPPVPPEPNASVACLIVPVEPVPPVACSLCTDPEPFIVASPCPSLPSLDPSTNDRPTASPPGPAASSPIPDVPATSPPAMVSEVPSVVESPTSSQLPPSSTVETPVADANDVEMGTVEEEVDSTVERTPTRTEVEQELDSTETATLEPVLYDQQAADKADMVRTRRVEPPSSDLSDVDEDRAETDDESACDSGDEPIEDVLARRKAAGREAASPANSRPGKKQSLPEHLEELVADEDLYQVWWADPSVSSFVKTFLEGHFRERTCYARVTEHRPGKFTEIKHRQYLAELATYLVFCHIVQIPPFPITRPLIALYMYNYRAQWPEESRSRTYHILSLFGRWTSHIFAVSGPLRELENWPGCQEVIKELQAPITKRKQSVPPEPQFTSQRKSSLRPKSATQTPTTDSPSLPSSVPRADPIATDEPGSITPDRSSILAQRKAGRPRLARPADQPVALAETPSREPPLNHPPAPASRKNRRTIPLPAIGDRSESSRAVKMSTAVAVIYSQGYTIGATSTETNLSIYCRGPGPGDTGCSFRLGAVYSARKDLWRVNQRTTPHTHKPSILLDDPDWRPPSNDPDLIEAVRQIDEKSELNEDLRKMTHGHPPTWSSRLSTAPKSQSARLQGPSVFAPKRPASLKDVQVVASKLSSEPPASLSPPLPKPIAQQSIACPSHLNTTAAPAPCLPALRFDMNAQGLQLCSPPVDPPIRPSIPARAAGNPPIEVHPTMQVRQTGQQIQAATEDTGIETRGITPVRTGGDLGESETLGGQSVDTADSEISKNKKLVHGPIPAKSFYSPSRPAALSKPVPALNFVLDTAPKGREEVPDDRSASDRSRSSLQTNNLRQNAEEDDKVIDMEMSSTASEPDEITDIVAEPSFEALDAESSDLSDLESSCEDSNSDEDPEEVSDAESSNSKASESSSSELGRSHFEVEMATSKSRVEDSDGSEHESEAESSESTSRIACLRAIVSTHTGTDSAL